MKTSHLTSSHLASRRHACTRTNTSSSLFQVNVMLPNTAMLKPMVNSALMILLVTCMNEKKKIQPKQQLTLLQIKKKCMMSDYSLQFWLE